MVDPLSWQNPPQFKLPKGFLISVIIFSLLMLTVPMGVFLVQNRTNLIPKAKILQGTKVGFELKENGREEFSNILPVSLLFNSETEGANVFDAKIIFPQDFLEVQSIATSSAQRGIATALFLDKNKKDGNINHWFEVKFDNEIGEISIVAGAPIPGMKTKVGSQNILATINFKVKKRGQATLSFDGKSAIYSNLTNQNILNGKPPLTLNLPEELALKYFPSCTQRPDCLDAKPACKLAEPIGGWCPKPEEEISSLELQRPRGGEIYSMNNSIPITWNFKNLDKVSLYLYLNEALFGKIAESSASSRIYNWIPAKTLPPLYLSEENTFQLEVSSKNKAGNVLRARSLGPFSIFPKNEIPRTQDLSNIDISLMDFDQDGKTTVSDISILFSNFSSTNSKYDLNKDGITNGIDVWIMKKQIFKD